MFNKFMIVLFLACTSKVFSGGASGGYGLNSFNYSISDSADNNYTVISNDEMDSIYKIEDSGLFEVLSVTEAEDGSRVAIVLDLESQSYMTYISYSEDSQ